MDLSLALPNASTDVPWGNSYATASTVVVCVLCRRTGQQSLPTTLPPLHKWTHWLYEGFLIAFLPEICSFLKQSQKAEKKLKVHKIGIATSTLECIFTAVLFFIKVWFCYSHCLIRQYLFVILLNTGFTLCQV